MNMLDPQAGQWYRHLDKGEMFQVIDADAEEGIETVHERRMKLHPRHFALALAILVVLLIVATVAARAAG